MLDYAVETEFSMVRYQGDEKRADATYEGIQPLTGADIAGLIVHCVLRFILFEIKLTLLSRAI